MSANDSSGIYRNQATVQTTDATVTTCGFYTLPDECGAHINAKVIGIQSGSTNVNVYWIEAAVEGQAGTRALVGAATFVVPEATHEDTAAWTVTIDVSVNDVRVRVTGAAATTIDWQATIEIIVYKP